MARSNDVCRELSPNRYLDVLWSPARKSWLAVVGNVRIGYLPTRRRALKLARRRIRAEQLIDTRNGG